MTRRTHGSGGAQIAWVVVAAAGGKAADAAGRGAGHRDAAESDAALPGAPRSAGAILGPDFYQEVRFVSVRAPVICEQIRVRRANRVGVRGQAARDKEVSPVVILEGERTRGR